MMLSRLHIELLLAGLTILGAGAVCGQDYPVKTIRIITSEPGGGPDLAARLVAPVASSYLGQPMIVDNRSGGGSIYGGIVAKAAPDGYTLLVTGNAFWIGPLMRAASYDPVKDFSAVSLLFNAPNIVVMHPSLPTKSIRELIELARRRPGELNFASSTIGSSPHLAAELFKAMAGVNIVHIPYKSGGAAAINLIGGQIEFAFATAASVAPYIKSGRVKALAVTSAKPTALAPGLPTVSASGLPGYESVSTIGMFAPARTPMTIINRINQEVVRAVTTADVKEKFFNAGVEAAGSTPEEFSARVYSDVVQIGKLIKDAGIRAD